VYQLIETIAGELERPRELSARVMNYITGHYGIDTFGIDAFLVDEIPKLEDDEIDLILSPVFTPKLADQAVFADLLGEESVPRDQWPALIQQLAARPTRAQLVTADGLHHSVGLREVTIERYVYRLRLDATIPQSVFKILDRIPSKEDAPMVKAVARQAIWESEGAREIFVRYLTAAVNRGGYSLGDTIALLHLVEDRKPANLTDMVSRIPAWQEALRHQIEAASGPKPFFNEDVRLLHGGGRDQRAQDDIRMTAKEKDLRFLVQLQLLLAE
jgi:hypothetical protein